MCTLTEVLWQGRLNINVIPAVNTCRLSRRQLPFENERHAIGIDNGKMRILVIQIAGILARRIVSWVTLGHKLEQGECYGMIKFGSSTELVVPRNVEIVCHKGDTVVGGVTILGRIKHEL
jgi:phosphatidylserine decarboxylase